MRYDHIGSEFVSGETMAYKIAIIAAAAACALISATPSSAATLAECAKQWNELKEAGNQGDLTYREFSQKCMRGDVAAEEPKEEKKKAEAKKKPKQVVEVDDESEGESSFAQKKACDGKWKTHKASTGASGWKAYFTYMSKCM
jgi:hypothetical protein